MTACAEKNFEIKVIDGVKTAINPEMPISPFTMENELEIPEESKDYTITELRDFAVDKEKNIYILDRKQCKVFKFNKAGEFQKTISQKGEGPGELSMPGEIYISPENTLLVKDIMLRQLIEFDTEGNCLTQMKLDILYPINLVRYPDGTYLCNGEVLKQSEGKHYALHRLTSDFKLKESFFEIDNPDTPISFVEHNGKILTNNKIGNEITVITNNQPELIIKRKVYLKGKIIKRGFCKMMYTSSNSLNIDSKGNIYVITNLKEHNKDEDDSKPKDVLQVFNPEGKQILNMAIPNYITNIKVIDDDIYGYGLYDNKLIKYGSIF